MCFAGSIRDVLLMKNFDLISIIAALFAVMAVYNLAAGSFHLGFSGQPIAHSQHLWNILGMYVVGFAAVLAGGCPLRQLILAGQGSSDSAVTFLGMLLARRLRITSVWSVRRQRLRPKPRRRFPAARRQQARSPSSSASSYCSLSQEPICAEKKRLDKPEKEKMQWKTLLK